VHKWQDNLDKLILFVLFLILLATVIHMTHHQIDNAIVAWGREQTGIILGALLGMITPSMRRSGEDK
jgi:hypothetical protein